jgi:hypothetical protein
MFVDICCNFRRWKIAENIQKHTRTYNRNKRYLESANKSDNCINKGSCNHLIIIQEISEQYTGKA